MTFLLKVPPSEGKNTLFKGAGYWRDGVKEEGGLFLFSRQGIKAPVDYRRGAWEPFSMKSEVSVDRGGGADIPEGGRNGENTIFLSTLDSIDSIGNSDT